MFLSGWISFFNLPVKYTLPYDFKQIKSIQRNFTFNIKFTHLNDMSHKPHDLFLMLFLLFFRLFQVFKNHYNLFLEWYIITPGCNSFWRSLRVRWWRNRFKNSNYSNWERCTSINRLVKDVWVFGFYLSLSYISNIFSSCIRLLMTSPEKLMIYDIFQ